MAKYTIELRKVCDIYTREEVEKWFKSYKLTDYLREDEIKLIENSGIWNKDRLAKKIVDHYFMREIGFETPGLFKHYAEVTMNELMEEKLPFIYSSAIKYDPLVNVDYTETFQKTGSENGTNQGSIDSSTTNEGKTNNTSSAEGNSNSSSNNKGSNLEITNKTPQTRITKQQLESGIYASSTNQNETENSINDETNTSSSATNQQTNSSSGSTIQTNTSSSKLNNTEEYTKRIKGNSGVSATAQAMVKQYRENIIAIDRDIIKELNILFMGLY